MNNEGLIRCTHCGGDVGLGGSCLQCGRKHPPEMTDEQLHHVVGGMGVLGGISIGLGLLRLFQGSKIRRELRR